MTTQAAWKPFPTGVALALLAVWGCASFSHDGISVPYAGIHSPILPPALPAPAPRSESLPTTPSEAPRDSPGTPDNPAPATAATQGSSLQLAEVLASVDAQFPLLVAAAQERAIASGQRLAAEGPFDLNLRTRGITQSGSFPSDRMDVLLEQATPFGGISTFGGYRFGFGDYPVYYGDRKTADGGEFRGGILLPLLRDGPIDRRRATLRQAQITELLAEPVIQRARIDALRAAARAYWAWVAAGEQYRITDALLRIARDRQSGLEEEFKKGNKAEFIPIDNRRVIVEREGARIAAERRFQQASFELSLYLRDQTGTPLVVGGDRLPTNFMQSTPTQPMAGRIQADIEAAYALRPELARFQLLKERVAVDLRLAQNQRFPALNATVAGSQDLGKAKKDLDRAVLEASLLLDVPLQRREARGREQAAQANLMQLLAQERYARDQIAAEIQDATSNLDRTYQRLERAREEQKIAQRVADLEFERFIKGAVTLFEVNQRELAAAGAQVKVVEALADYYRGQADYRAALGLDARPDGPTAP